MAAQSAVPGPEPGSSSPSGAAWGKDYQANSDRRYFRTPPSPVAVSPATQLPSPVASDVIAKKCAENALATCGVSKDQLSSFSQDGGVDALVPIARLFGEAALTELFGRLRYPPDRLVAPFHGYDGDANAIRQLGVRSTAVLLVPRLLACIPGHFRQLARRTEMPEEAHAMECLGWILMYALRTGMRRVKQPAWWVPPAPAFAAEYPDPGPPLADTISQVIRTTGSVDTTLKKFPIYRRLFSRWDSGIAGSMWRMETGARKSQFGFPPGLPF